MVRQHSPAADSRSPKSIDPDSLGEREAKVVIERTANDVERTANDVDQVKRSSPRNLVYWHTGSTGFSQGANYYKTFVAGSPHRTRLPIITLHAVLVTREQQSGSFKEVSLQNGNSLVPCCGSMASVRSYYHSNPILANGHFF